MKKLNVLLLIFHGLFVQAQEPTFKVTKLVDNGSPGNRVNFVIMGDGYTQAEIPTFIKNATDIANFMKKFPPYSNYASYINIYAIEVISNESGTDEKDKGIKRDTYLNSGFNHDMARLLTTDSGKCSATAARHVPEYDQIIVLVNTLRYGGSGGYISVSWNGGSSTHMNIHEVGHSFAGLADEYTYGHNDIISYEPHQRNVTIETNRNKIKWNKWINESTPIPTLSDQGYNNTVGLFEGGFYRPKGVYRPQHDCMMRTMFTSFCKICKESHIHKFHKIVNIIDNHLPRFGQLPITDSFNFFVKPVNPSTHNMDIQWFLDGIAKNSSSIYSVQPGEISLGKHKMKVVVSDPQPDVKYPIKESKREVEWVFSVIDTKNQLRPVAVLDNYSVLKNKVLKIGGIGITANDYDLNGDLFTASLVSTTSNGTLSLQSKGSFTYTPDNDFVGADSFTYKINDGKADSLPVKVTLRVTEKDVYKEDFSSSTAGFFTTLQSPLGTFSATPNFFETKEINKLKYIKIHKNTNQTTLTLNLSEKLKKVNFRLLSFNLEQLFPGSTGSLSQISIEEKSEEGRWATLAKLESIYPQSDFSVDLEGRRVNAFRFTFTSKEEFKLYSISLEKESSEVEPPETVEAFTVNFDLDGKGVRIGGGRLAQRVISETAATAPRVQAKPGFQLTGWSTSLSEITSDTTIRALYKEVLSNDKLKLDLTKGWNFISIPLKNADLKPLLKGINGKCWKWGKKNAYEPVNSADPQQGLWVNVKKDKTIIVTGEPANSETITLKFGWNAYGPHKEGTIPKDIEAIFTWENNKYRRLDKNTDKLKRGRAYWIFSTKQKDTELRVEP